MNNKYRRALMWALYGALFVLTLLIQTSVFGRQRFFGTKLSFLPVAVICISLWCGHEAGGLFGLLAGLVWSWSGGSDGAVSIVTFAACGILAGYLCDAVCSQRFVSAVLLSLGGLILHQTADFLLHRYLTDQIIPLRWLLIQIILSLPACLVLYPLTKLIRKAGGI